MIMKTVTAATIAMTLAGAGSALAQQAPTRPQTPPSQTQPSQTPSQAQPQERGEARRGPSAEDVAAYTDARIAALKAGLKLTPDQEKNWPAVETAIRDIAKQRTDRLRAEREQRAERRNGGQQAAAPDAIARMRRIADNMEARGTALKKFADAAQPLYNSLDNSQKRRFAALVRMGVREGFMGQRMHRMMRRGEGRG